MPLKNIKGLVMTVSHEKSRTNIYLDIHLKEQAKEIYKQYGLGTHSQLFKKY